MLTILIYKSYLNPDSQKLKKNFLNCGNLSINSLFNDFKKLFSIYCDNRDVGMFIESPYLFKIKLFEITVDSHAVVRNNILLVCPSPLSPQ